MAKNKKNLVGENMEWELIFSLPGCKASLSPEGHLMFTQHFSSPPYPGPSSCTPRCWPLLHIAALSNLPNAVTSQANQPPGGTSGQAKRFQLGTMEALHVMTNKALSFSLFQRRCEPESEDKTSFVILEKKLRVNGKTRFFRWNFTNLRLVTSEPLLNWLHFYSAAQQCDGTPKHFAVAPHSPIYPHVHAPMGGCCH